MTIEVELDDGTILEFPDGTSPQVIQNAVRQIIGVSEGPPVVTGEEVIPQRFGQETPTGGDPNLVTDIAGGLQAAASIASAAVAEPIAGLTGIAAAALPGGRTGAEQVEATREALTLRPQSREAQEALQAVGEVIEPVAEAFTAAERFLGDKTFELTESPALAAAARSIPTAISEVLGFSFARAGVRGARQAREGRITREISEAVPTPDELKAASRDVFNEIDELGVTVKPDAYTALVGNISREVNKRGLDPDITPSAAKALRRLEDRVGDDINLSELDTLREVAQGAAGSLNPKEKMLGMVMIDSIDNFLDTTGTNSLNRPEGLDVNIADRYRAARDLWGRARKSELINESIETARNQASGFENGIRVQFRRILNNKKQRKFFKENELNAIRQVVEGTPGANITKLLGRLGFSEGGATNILGGAAGVAGGGVVGGVPGAVIVPVIGQVSRKVSQLLTQNNARLADEVIRAGTSGRDITRAYLRNIPKAERSAEDLSQLLMRSDIDLDSIAVDEIALSAARIARERRASLISAAAAGALAPEEQEDQLLPLQQAL